MDTPVPGYLQDADPRVHGFSYTEGVVPNDLFSSGLGGVPSSDGAPAVRASGDGTVSPQAQEALQQQQQQQQQQAQQAQNVHTQAPQVQPLYQSMPAGAHHPPSDQSAHAQIPRSQPDMPPLFPNQPGAGAYAGLATQNPRPPTGPAHQPPGYPWQGHPQAGEAAPYVGPNHTSPMQRGGPNLPAYAAAPGQPMTVGGAVYPYTPPGTALPSNGNPLFGGFAGVDLDALDSHLAGELGEDNDLGRMRKKRQRKDRTKREKSRDVKGKDGQWVYRQFSDGRIVIVVSGHPSLPVGSVLQSGSHPRQWNAITAEIGTWEEYRKDRLQRAGRTALSLLEAGGKAAGRVRRGRRRGRRGRGRRGGRSQPPVEPEIPLEPEPEGLPSWALPVGVLAVGGILFFVVSQSKSAPAKRGKSKS